MLKLMLVDRGPLYRGGEGGGGTGIPWGRQVLRGDVNDGHAHVEV